MVSRCPSSPRVGTWWQRSGRGQAGPLGDSPSAGMGRGLAVVRGDALGREALSPVVQRRRAGGLLRPPWGSGGRAPEGCQVSHPARGLGAGGSCLQKCSHLHPERLKSSITSDALA